MQTKEQKKAVIVKLTDAFKNAASVVFVHFRGVSVADESAMRRKMRKAGVGYTVAKKTLLRKALEAAGHAHKELSLEGEIAIAHGGADSVAVARIVHEFAKKLADKIAIVGGIFEGALAGEDKMRMIATIPPMDTLRAMFAQVINSPRQRFAIALSEVAKTKGV